MWAIVIVLLGSLGFATLLVWANVKQKQQAHSIAKEAVEAVSAGARACQSPKKFSKFQDSGGGRASGVGSPQYGSLETSILSKRKSGYTSGQR